MLLLLSRFMTTSAKDYFPLIKKDRLKQYNPLKKKKTSDFVQKSSEIDQKFMVNLNAKLFLYYSGTYQVQ